MSENATPPRGDRTGRTAKTPTKALAAELATLLRAGVQLDVAAETIGLDRHTLEAWLRKGARAPHGRYRDMHTAVMRARAEGEARHVAIIAAAARENWQAAAWLLERGYPERWARLSQRERSGAATTERPLPSAGDPFAEVDELARRRREGGS
jgi:hypothetical protein